jgi:small-conductance mechanosensitive channel
MDWQDRLAKDLPAFDVRLFEISGTPVTIATLAVFVIVLLATLLIAQLLQRLFVRAFTARGQQDEGSIAASARLIRYGVWVTGLAVAVHSVGINLTALFAAGAVFAVAIGFAMQNIAQNFVSGVIVLAERAIKPGDVLEVDGRLVQVKDMGIRATIARTLDEEDIIIPNSQLVTTSVTNYTLRDSRYRLRARVGVTYSSDMARVREVLESTAAGLDWRSQEERPRILLVDFADSAVVWEVSVWMHSPWQMASRRSDLNEAIWWALKDAGITIAFPQVDVHFDPPVSAALETLGAGRPAR